MTVESTLIHEVVRQVVGMSDCGQHWRIRPEQRVLRVQPPVSLTVSCVGEPRNAEFSHYISFKYLVWVKIDNIIAFIPPLDALTVYVGKTRSTEFSH